MPPAASASSELSATGSSSPGGACLPRRLRGLVARELIAVQGNKTQPPDTPSPPSPPPTKPQPAPALASVILSESKPPSLLYALPPPRGELSREPWWFGPLECLPRRAAHYPSTLPHTSSSRLSLFCTYPSLGSPAWGGGPWGSRPACQGSPLPTKSNPLGLSPSCSLYLDRSPGSLDTVGVTLATASGSGLAREGPGGRKRRSLVT